MSIERRTILEQVVRDVISDGRHLEDLISDLQQLQIDYSDATKLVIDFDLDSENGYTGTVDLQVFRLENDEEYTRRTARELDNPKVRAQINQLESELAELRKKFPFA